MTLTDVFDQLSAGELSQFFIGNINEGGLGDDTGIVPEDYKRIIPLVNLGIIELHKRFQLKLCTVIIQLKPGKTKYRLVSKNSYRSNDPTSEKFIMDSPYEPFEDNIIEITQAHNEKGDELFLNVENGIWSIYTPEYNLVECPYPDGQNAISITYSAHPKAIPKDITDLSTVDLQLPPIFLEALVMYIGSRLYSGLSVDGDNGNTQAYLQRFENSCVTLRKLNSSEGFNRINTNLERNGWV